MSSTQVLSHDPSSHRLTAQLRITLIIMTIIAGALTGHILTRIHGKNFNGGTEYIDGIGTLHRVPMPRGITTLEQIRKPWIGATGADDFFRVFVNNYLLLTNEPTSVVLGGCMKGLPFDPATCPPIWERALPSTTRYLPTGHSFGHYLRPEWNHLIVEVENYKEGYCGTGLDFEIGGTPIQNFVSIIPPASEHVRRLTGNPPNLANALCDRRIYQFYLEPVPLDS